MVYCLDLYPKFRLYIALLVLLLLYIIVVWGDGIVVEMHCQEVQSGVVPAKVVGLNPTVLFLSCGFLLST